MPRVVAVDIPSGLHPDTGAADDAVLPASVTVTFGAVKAGLVARTRAGATRETSCSSTSGSAGAEVRGAGGGVIRQEDRRRTERLRQRAGQANGPRARVALMQLVNG